MKQKLCNK